MSTPAGRHHRGNVSAVAGVTLSDQVTAQMEVTPQDNGDIVCGVTCNDREVLVTFQADGDIDTEVKA